MFIAGSKYLKNIKYIYIYIYIYIKKRIDNIVILMNVTHINSRKIFSLVAKETASSLNDNAKTLVPA